MKIEQITIKSFNCLKDFKADFNGNNVFLVGKNRIGKTSAIRFIQIALGDSRNVPDDFDGTGIVIASKEGKEYKFEVKSKAGKPVVTVTSPNGLKDIRKGALLEITGAINFDIDEFVQYSNTKAGQKKQVEIFKSFLGEEINEAIVVYERNIATKYEERTELNRIIKEVESFINNHPLRMEINLDKFQPIDVSTKTTDLTAANETNKKIADVISRVVERKKDIDRLNSEEEELKAQIEAIAKKIETINLAKLEATSLNSKAAVWLDSNKEISVSEIIAEIDSAALVNKKAEQAKELSEKIKSLEQMKEDSGELTALIDSERQLIQDTIRQMDSPVEGLSFDEDTLIYNGVAVNEKNLSTSEKMELGIKLKIAENKEFGILFLQRAESFDETRIEQLLAIAKDNDMQIIAEEVRRGQEELTIEIMGS